MSNADLIAQYMSKADLIALMNSIIATEETTARVLCHTRKTVAVLREALLGIDTFAWSALEADCPEALIEINRRVAICRAALALAEGTERQK